MKNETIKNEKAHKQAPIFKNSKQSQQEKLSSHYHAWWLSLINDAEAWLKKEELSSTRHYHHTNIDPREFLGTAPPFSWE